ncbi:MAG: putative Mg2+ transporter-C (MgtC) family protein, partial [Acidimicrobiaceae bacterium]|nr:putative Mg2+ transporter-C (MgtC) family protein [Acidimicrobiaceae bacterium]
MSHADLVLLGRTSLAFVLSFVIGFERELRGAPAGDRTYALVGTGAAAITAVTYGNSPQAIAGVVTGIGFIGAGLVFRGDRGMLRGMTSAACIFVVAALGIVSGTGHVVLALLVTVIVLLDLELRHLPLLRGLDARRYSGKVADDADMPGMD